MKLLVIDGNSIINRAFYGIRLLSNKKGVFTNAVTGFLNIYLKLIAAYRPDGAAAAFDLKAPTFRHKAYDGYKAGRKKMPDELAVQMPYVKDILRAMGVKVVEREGYEADDILGTLSHACDERGYECIIATGDRDSFQLITDKVFVNLASTKEDILYTPEKIFEVYGVAPAEMLEVKALMGDSSDNIPGVPGIGEKTALSLIQKYHTIKNIYSDLDSVEVSKSVKDKLEKGRESADLSRMLGEIVKNAPIDTEPAGYRFSGRDDVALAAILSELEMFSMIKKLGIGSDAMSAAAAASSQEAGGRAAGEPADAGAPDAPASGAEAASAELPADIPPLSSEVPDYWLDGDGKLFVCVNGQAREADASELASPAPKRTFDLKAMLTALDCEINNVVFDSTLSAYLLNVAASEYTLDRLCAEYKVPLENSGAETVWRLNCALHAKLAAEGMEKLLEEIEIPLAYVLVSMEKEGIAIDREALVQFGKRLSDEADDLAQQIFVCAGEPFNIGSPKQLGNILFEKLGLPHGKKTKTGYSTNAEVLEELRGKDPIIDLILRWRAVTKLDSTYAQGLLKEIADDGRIHTTFKQTETRTGRISSAEPNIQNIPVRTELGREFRRFFTARDGYVLVDADYSQIELRILAHLSDDKMMTEAFRSGEDIHTVTASQVFDQPVEWVTPEMRRSAKAVNFGIVYGIGAFSLSKDINVSVAQADAYIKSYLAKYSGVDAYMKRTVEDGKKNGYVSTMWGRRRYIPELSASNKNVQALGKRMAMNTPVQGTAADIIKLAMIKVYKRLAEEKLDAKLILQVHDELIAEAREDCADRVAEIISEEMEHAAELRVPLTVDAKTGKTWYEAH
ncbi:MAG: DNA polymerase I [Ruminiclostridium sp.]|nr:DNA polymerase I [Ruminiclostridium sp.]